MKATHLYSLTSEDNQNVGLDYGDVDHYYRLHGPVLVTKEMANEWAEARYYRPRCAGQDFVSRHSVYLHAYNGTAIVVLHEELDI